MKFLLRMLFARRPAEAPAAQLGLFGGGGAPQPPPAPATSAREGVGAMHQVRTHTRVDAHGVHLVQQHERVGKGHQAKPTGHREESDPLDPKALFRLGGAQLRELLEVHKGDPVARGKVQAELDRRAAKRASKRGTETAPPTGHKLTDELVERVPGFDGGDEFRHGGHDWNVEQAGDNVEFHPVERGADADGLVEHLDGHGVDATAREEVVVATGVRAEDPEPKQPPQDKEQATRDRWEAIHQRLEDEREAMYAKMIGRGQPSSERKKLVAASEDEEALRAHLQVETDPFVRQVAERRLAELEAKRKAAEPEPAATDEDEDEVEERAAKDDGPVGDGAVTARSASRGSETAIEEASRALGEHIAYSRKDMATLRGAAALEEARRSGATAMDIDKMLRKDKVFDKPEYAQLHNLGVPPDVAQARVELHGLIAAKPSVPSKLMKRMDARALAAAAEIVQAGYAQMAEWWPKQLDAATNLHDVELTLARLGQWATHGRELSEAMTAEEVIAYMGLDAAKVRIPPGELSGPGSGWRLRGERGDYWIPQRAMMASGSSGWWANSFHPEAGRRYHVMGMPDAAMKLRYGGMASSCGDRFLAVCADDSRRNQLLRAAKGKTWSDHLVDEVGKMEAKDKREQSPKAKLAGFVHGHRGADSYERVGPELPRIAGEDLLKRYGFRGVQTGQKAWVSDEAFAGHLQHTHEAFADLAHVLGMDERHVSHGGLLGMAFGARGKGGRAGAHYEPSDLVINLTQTKGGGALAHEWGHFFDHIMTNKARPVRTTVDGKEVTRNGEELVMQGTGRKVEFRSHFLSHEDVNEELPEPVRDALHGVLDAMHGRHASYRELQSVLKRSREARERHGMHSREYMQHGETRAALQRAVDKHVSDRQLSLKDGDSMAFADAAMLLGDYWSAPHEMWARAFESYIEDKLDAQGRKNNYLVTGTRRGGIEMTINVGSRGRTATVLAHAYPMGEERARINAAFDRFFDTVRQHQLLRKAVARLMLPRLIKSRPGTVLAPSKARSWR